MEKVHTAFTHCSALPKNAVGTEDGLLLLQQQGHVVLRVTRGVQDSQCGTWNAGLGLGWGGQPHVGEGTRGATSNSLA